MQVRKYSFYWGSIVVESEPVLYSSIENNPWRSKQAGPIPRLTNFQLQRDLQASSGSAAGGGRSRPWWRWRDRNLHLAALVVGALLGGGIIWLIESGAIDVHLARAAQARSVHAPFAACSITAGGTE
jgi:hypothetical protein